MNTQPFSDQWKRLLKKKAGQLGIQLSQQQIEDLALHIFEMLSANRKFNLTAINDPSEVITRHIIDSLMPCRYIRENVRVLDIGSGGGFPGIPIKILRPDLSITLLDRSRKKVNFLKYIIRRLGLTGIEAVQMRLEKNEDASNPMGEFDVIISRAFSSLLEFVAIAKPLLALSGMILAMKGPDVKSEIEAIRQRSTKKNEQNVRLGFKQLEMHSYRLPDSDIDRIIVAIQMAS